MQTYSDNKLMSIDANNNRFIRELLIIIHRHVLYGILGRERTMRETETVGTVYIQNYRHCTKGGS